MSCMSYTMILDHLRKILRKIFSPICGNRELRRKTNHELYELYDDVELSRPVKIQRLHWLAHVVRIDRQTTARWVFEADPLGVGRPAKRWRKQAEYDISCLGISNWRQIAGG